MERSAMEDSKARRLTVPKMLKLIAFIVAVNTPFHIGCNAEWQPDDEGFDTVHKNLRHFQYSERTPYKTHVKYSIEPTYSYLGMKPTHYFIHLIFSSDPEVARGYISTVKESSELEMGTYVEENEWKDLLAKNKLLIFWILLISLIIIIMPFIGICYCCFCCCVCPAICPPCQLYSDIAKRTLFSIWLLMLILGILFGLIIAFLNDKLIDSGFQRSSEDLLRSGEDTCVFLKDVRNHVKHVFRNNFQEMKTDAIAQLYAVDAHVFTDLKHVSGLYPLTDMMKIFDTMPKALRLMKQMEIKRDSLFFMMAQFRDGLRGAKREMNYILTVWCEYLRCHNFLRKTKVMTIDTSSCLHLDKIPEFNLYINGMNDIIKNRINAIPRSGILRLQALNDMIKKSLQPQIPPLLKELSRVHADVEDEIVKISKALEKLMNEVYFKNARTSQSFNAFNERFASDRKLISIIVCCTLLAIVIILFIALVCGCCVRRDNTGSTFLIIAIVLIFMFVSFLLLVSLFYFVIGLLMHHAVCVPRSDAERRELFRPIEESANDSLLAPPLGETGIINMCNESQTIFHLLQKRRLYNINSLRRLFMSNDKAPPVEFTGDLTNIKILTLKEIDKLNKARNGQLGPYHSKETTKFLCSVMSPDIKELDKNMSAWIPKFNQAQHDDNMKFFVAVSNNNLLRTQLDLISYIDIQNTVQRKIEQLKAGIVLIDPLITRKQRNFNSTIKQLIDDITKAEIFLRTKGSNYIITLVDNLTSSLVEDVNVFIEHVITESKTNIGRMQPLCNAYTHNIDTICNNLANPINGFWLGLLICGLLLLPTLFVAHRLICLFRVYWLIRSESVIYLDAPGHNCPTCTGVPFVAPPTVICSGGEQAHCPCADTSKRKQA